MKPDWREYEAMEKAILKLEAALAERDAEIDRLKLQVSATKHNLKVTQKAFDEDEATIRRLREENSKLKSEILEHDLVECECNDGTCGICELNKALENDNT